jgi:hypothetical protein
VSHTASKTELSSKSEEPVPLSWLFGFGTLAA